MPSRVYLLNGWRIAGCLVAMVTLSGCGDGEFPVRAAKGKVVCAGKPVTVGSVTFTPLGDEGKAEVGKAATAMVGADGTFVLTTFNQFDGAIVGKHRVQYVGSEGEEEEAEEEATASEGSRAEAAENAKKIRERRAARKSQCVMKGELIVEVKTDGDNDFTIELVPLGR